MSIAQHWVSFDVPGDPQGKGRAKARHGQIKHYTPAKTVAYEKLIAQCAAIAKKGKPVTHKPVVVEVVARFAVPPSYSKKEREACLTGLQHPGKRPDIDNIIKAVADGCNGVLWLDDAQIVGLVARKVYGLEAKVKVNVAVLDDDESQIEAIRGAA